MSDSESDDDEYVSLQRMVCGKEVWNRVALKTAGGMKRDDLVQNKRGKIVSNKMPEAAKVRYRLNKECSVCKRLFHSPNTGSATPSTPDSHKGDTKPAIYFRSCTLSPTSAHQGSAKCGRICRKSGYNGRSS